MPGIGMHAESGASKFLAVFGNLDTAVVVTSATVSSAGMLSAVFCLLVGASSSSRAAVPECQLNSEWPQYSVTLLNSSK
jgi:hypothetical protein